MCVIDIKFKNVYYWYLIAICQTFVIIISLCSLWFQVTYYNLSSSERFSLLLVYNINILITLYNYYYDNDFIITPIYQNSLLQVLDYIFIALGLYIISQFQALTYTNFFLCNHRV